MILLRVFLGVDPRQPLAYTVLQNSIIRRASKPVAVTPLILSQLPITRQGLTQFTFSRYLPPFLCDYEGYSIFFDADMLVQCDVYEMLEHCDLTEQGHSVYVVKNKLRFEWPSMMLFNNALCKKLTPEYIDEAENVGEGCAPVYKNHPQSFDWAQWGVGDLPAEYNVCVGYDEPRPDAKVIHYTQGLPCFPETEDSPYREEWFSELQMCNSTVKWADIMGNSVHAQPVLKRIQERMAAQ